MYFLVTMENVAVAFVDGIREARFHAKLNNYLRKISEDTGKLQRIANPNLSPKLKSTLEHNEWLNKTIRFLEDPPKINKQLSKVSQEWLDYLKQTIQNQRMSSEQGDYSHLVDRIIRKHEYLFVRFQLVDGSLKMKEKKEKLVRVFKL